MQQDIARIIIKHIVIDAATELINREIETEADFDKHAEAIISKLLEKHYAGKFANLQY